MDSKSLSHTKWKCQYHIGATIYTKISKKEIIRSVEMRCTGDIKHLMQIQRSRNYRRSCVCRSCTYVREHTAQAKRIKFYGIPEREEYAHDI